MNIFVGLFVSLVVGLLGVVSAQTADSVPVRGSASFAVTGSAEDEPSGSLFVADYGLGNTSLIVLSLPGARAYSARLRSGDCGADGEVVAGLEPVSATGLSVTVSTAALEQLLDNNYLDITDTEGTLVACSEIGAGAAPPQADETGATQDADTGDTTTQNDTQNTATQNADNPADATATGVRAEEFETQIPTASYGVFAVGDSGIAGQVQVVGRVEGGTRLVLSLQGAQAGERYPVDIRSGDCGPDGEVLLQLNDFPLGLAEANAGETEAELGFSAITEENNYLSVYAPDGSGRVLACGEVGVGANR